MGLLKRKPIDPVEMLHGQLAGLRVVWEMYSAMPVKQQSNALANMPAGLRNDYRAAKAADPVRADGLIAEARNNPARSGPPQMSWNQLLDHAVS